VPIKRRGIQGLTAETDSPLSETDCDGICHACDTLFSSEHYQTLAQRYLARKAPSLAVQELVFSSVGLYAPPSSGS
jgi:hypothetical protein